MRRRTLEERVASSRQMAEGFILVCDPDADELRERADRWRTMAEQWRSHERNARERRADLDVADWGPSRADKTWWTRHAKAMMREAMECEAMAEVYAAALAAKGVQG